MLGHSTILEDNLMWFVIGLLVGVIIATILNVFIDDLLEENHNGE